MITNIILSLQVVLVSNCKRNMHIVVSFMRRVIRKLVYYALLSPLIRRTNWYKNLFVDDIYPGNIWYREHEERNFDLVVLGSSGAKWAFEFSEQNIKAMNWAQQPQTLVEDYNLLRNFHSILRKGGVVLITIMPFTGLNKQTGIHDALKYLHVHSHEPIQPYLYDEAQRIAYIPFLMGKPAIKALIKYLIGKDEPLQKYTKAMVSYNPMSSAQLEENALSFINGWKAQFSIEDFDAPLTPVNQQGRNFRVNLMRELIDFCTERTYKPVYIIPPVTSHLSQYYTPKFEETYVYGFLREVDRDILLLDYSKDEELKQDDLFFNSFFFNSKGRKLFTRRVINDLSIS